MLSADLLLFQAVNATPATPEAVVALARLVSEVLPVALGCLLGFGLLAGALPLRRALVRSLAALALAWLAVTALRWAWPLPRPAQIGLGFQWLAHTGRAGFPSMHTACMFALAASLGLSRPGTPGWRLLVAAGWALALLMAWSRLCLGVHFPSDVLGGALAGAGSAWLASRAVLGTLPRLQLRRL